MKQIHNVRIRVHHANQEVVDDILSRAEAMARRDERDTIERTVEDNGAVWSGQLWIDHQQPVRRFVTALKAGLGGQTRDIANRATAHLDTGTHCFIHLERAAFQRGEFQLTQDSDSVAIRLNIAAYPATRERALSMLRELFA